MASFNVIQCDACKNEDPVDPTTAQQWSKFAYTLSSPNRIDAEGIDLCPTCAAKMFAAIQGVMHGAEPAQPIESLEIVEKRHIIRALTAFNWNKSKVAQVLGFERSTLDRKLKRYGVTRSIDVQPGTAAEQLAEELTP